MAVTTFEEALENCLSTDSGRAGIGTYKEKTLHAVLKRYIEPDDNYQEVGVGSFVADIFNQNGIIEIQTRDFNNLRKKLAYFLNEHIVTIVYPIPATKWLLWVDPETGEATKQRKSPKTGSKYQAFRELYKIKQLLTNPNLRLRLMFLDMKEYRYLNGWSRDKKKGSSRCERIPVALKEELYINSPQEYRKLIPDTLSDGFSSADFAKAAGINKYAATTALNLLYYVGVVERAGKKGNKYLYNIII
jgi:hypothetical protein